MKRQLLYRPPDDPLATQYQLRKYTKHTVPDPTDQLQSIFATGSPHRYKDYIVDTLAAGAVELDARGRTNIILAAGKEVGFRFEYGQLVAPQDAIKVVLSSEDGRVHSFTVESEPFRGATCPDCGRWAMVV
jgi:hypothetical protein